MSGNPMIAENMKSLSARHDEHDDDDDDDDDDDLELE